VIFDARKVRFLYVAVFGLSALMFGINIERAFDLPDARALFGLVAFGFATFVFALALIRELRKVDDNG
jgi:hypothetical protein